MANLESLPGDIVRSELTKAYGINLADLGVQVRETDTQIIKLVRSANGISEKPAGTKNFIWRGAGPVEEGYYQVIWDNNNGDLSDPTRVAIDNLHITSTLTVVPTALGPIADFTKAHMAQTFDRLKDDAHYGSVFIVSRIEVIKRRVMTNPPAAADEDQLDTLVLDYLGKLVALELMPAAVDYWTVQYQSESTGNDPTEVASYPDRLKALEALEELLLKQVKHDEASVLPLLEGNRRLRTASDGPSIDEFDDCRVTEDPRNTSPIRTIQSRNGSTSTGVRV